MIFDRSYSILCLFWERAVPVSILSKIGWGFSIFLVAAGVGLLFWLDVFLGSFFAVFTGVVCWYVFWVIMKKTNVKIQSCARRLGLDFTSHPFRYGFISGTYKKRPVKISYESSRVFGSGTMAVLEGAPPGFAVLDVENVTQIKMGHKAGKVPEKLLQTGPPPVMVKGFELKMILTGVCTDFDSLNLALKHLSAHAVDLEAK